MHASIVQYFFYCEYEYDEWNIQTNDRQFEDEGRM